MMVITPYIRPSGQRIYSLSVRRLGYLLLRMARDLEPARAYSVRINDALIAERAS